MGPGEGETLRLGEGEILRLGEGESLRGGERETLRVEQLNGIYNPFSYVKRKSNDIAGIGGINVPKVFADLSYSKITSQKDLEVIGYFYNSETDKWNMNDMASDIIYLGNNEVPFELPVNLKPVYNYDIWKNFTDQTKGFPLFKLEEYLTAEKKSFVQNFISVSIENLQSLNLLSNKENIVLVLETKNVISDQRRVFLN